MRLILERLAPESGDRILDPSCGDGEFLIGAAHYLLDTGRVTDASQLAQCLIGFDVNPEAVAAAKSRLAALFRERLGVTVSEDHLRIECVNALDLPDREALIRRQGPLPGRLLIAGNPPYVEAKRLSADVKAHLKERFPAAASGAPDLYLYFLHACLDWLASGDRLALVLPNRVLVNSNGRRLRERLLARRQLWGIDFATRTQLFPDAAVYPVVLYAVGASEVGRALQLASISRWDNRLQRCALPDLQLEHYQATASRAFFPTPESPLLTELLSRLLGSLEIGRLADLLDVRWAVSFHRQGLREQYVKTDPAGMKHARKFLGGGTFSGNGDLERYRTRWSGWWIEYDAERLHRERNQLPPLMLFDQPKIVICQNARTLRAAYDDQCFVLKDTLLCGLLRESGHPLARYPRALVGVLASPVVHFYYSHVFHGGHVNGGYLHFLRSFLEDIPLGEWTETSAAELVALVRQREGVEPGADARALEARIEARVAEAFGLAEAQIAALQEWAAGDENWQARERVRRRAARQTNDGGIA